MKKIQNIVSDFTLNAKEKFAIKHIHLFLFGEHGQDALRNTLASIVPGLVLYYAGFLAEAIVIGLGTLFASLADLPGNRKDKLNTAIWTVPLFGLVAWITASATVYPIVLVLWLVVSAFTFTMISVDGNRFSAMGLMALVLVTFTVGLWPEHPLSYSMYITLGVIWYFLISVLQVLWFPYRSLRFALSDSFHQMAVMLRNKAQFYDDQVPLADAYRQLGTLHLNVSEQQENVRNLLLREKQLVDPDSEKGRYWIRQMLGVTDLYELLAALDHDYDAIRRQLAPLNVLPNIRTLILLLSDEVDLLSWKIAGGSLLSDNGSKDDEMQQIIAELSAERDTFSENDAHILGAIIRNSKQIINCIQQIRLVLKNKDQNQGAFTPYTYSNFISRTPRGVGALRNQFSFATSVFPFALRLALLFGIGGIIGLLLSEYRYTYWILITLVVVSRPGFANTNRRNGQRIIGTVIGILLGTGLLLAINPVGMLLLISVLGLFGFFFFNRIDYMYSVLCLTASIVVVLNVYEGNLVDILGSRIVFTLIGSLLALVGWFFIPIRQSKGLNKLALDIVESSAKYLEIISLKINFLEVEGNDLRLARKQAHSSLAVFSSAMNQLRREPGAKKVNWNMLYTFHSLAYRLNSLMIGLSVAAAEIHGDQELANLKRRTAHINTLQEELQKLATEL